MIKSRSGRRLDATPTEGAGNKKHRVFAFGNFAALKRPEQKQIDKSEKAIEKITSFESLRIFPSVRVAMMKEIKNSYIMKNTYITDKKDLKLAPSPVQIAAIKKINQPRKVAAHKLEQAGSPLLHEVMEENERNRLKIFTVAAETGSGKTWAYLAPVLSKLVEEEYAVFSNGKSLQAKPKNFQPVRAVILLPTHELVNQVYETVQFASTVRIDPLKDYPPQMRGSKDYGPFLESKPNLGLKVFKWGSGDPPSKLFNAADNEKIDVLITTPGKLDGLSKLDNISRPFRIFKGVNYCVVDEADTLMDESWLHETSRAIEKFTALRDLILCSATIPREFEKSLQTLFKDENSIIRVITPLIHKIPKKIAVKVIDAEAAPFHGSKTRCLAQALYAIYNDGTEAGFVKRVIVFVNEKKHVAPLVETLITKFGHLEEDVVGVTGRDSAADRHDKIAPFINQASPIEQDPTQSKMRVLVTTDLMARGLNFQAIKNVILMDVPRSSVDLIHRVGRTGRMRQSGRVFILIDRKSRKSWIKGLPNAIKQGATIG